MTLLEATAEEGRNENVYERLLNGLRDLDDAAQLGDVDALPRAQDDPEPLCLISVGASTKLSEEMALAKKNKASDLSSRPHPPYFQMICEAISALKEQTRSSQQAISKFIEAEYGGNLPPNFNKLLSVQLKRIVKSEKLVKVKNSFKIAATELWWL